MVVVSGDVRLPRFLRREAGAEVDRLYRRHADDVLRYARLVLRSRTDAEDITQTVFMRALRAIERGEKVRTPRNWLIKIAHNECRRLLASRKVHIQLPDEIAVEPVEQGRAEELRLAMAALPATQRQALVMRELEGRPYAEISQKLDLSISAVETLIFRARRALREQIENLMTCEEFASLLDDPSARPRVRAHARGCAACATLDHQSRGRKGALKRIASALGVPWWGVKLGAVALTTAAVGGAVAVSTPHEATRPHVPVAKSNVIPSNPNPNLVSPARFKRAAAKPAHVRVRVVAAPIEGVHPSLVAPPADAAADLTPPPPMPDPPKPGEPPLPPAAAAPAPPQAAVNVPQSVLPSVAAVPADAIPTTSIPDPAPALPTLILAVETPNVSLT
jgi:RNA polymerase sigma factor (sigma-70 family)